MKTIIMFILLFWLLPALPALGAENPCWPCWDCLNDCERGDGRDCCKDAKKECCDDCRVESYQYQACLDRVDSEESYIEHRTKRKINEYRQKFMDEMEDILPGE